MRQVIILICVLLIAAIAIYSEASAASITLPNGQELNIDNLRSDEITAAIKTAQKSMGAAQTSDIIEVVKGVKPNELEAWGKLVSGTIKTICNDLNVTVNEFVKTPVGIGVAALITYKIMGKDILDNALDIVVMTPLWFMMTGIVLFLGWYFYSNKTVYRTITTDEKGKKIKGDPVRVTRYNWDPTKENETPNKFLLAIILIFGHIIFTILTLVIVLTT